MIRYLYILLFLVVVVIVKAQYAPPAGQEGSTAMAQDSSVFVGWAMECEVENGLLDISNPDLGQVVFGESENATGYPDNSIVSLGDYGSAVLTFEYPVRNGPGYDFAVFENSFSDDFLELAFVEVSSDGILFERFPAVSLTQVQKQLPSFGSIDATEINNFAGKYRGGFGTPFDLEDLNGSSGLDLNKITHVRIIDVIGCIQDEYSTNDSEGNVVNDPWPTPFPSGGFDLDAVGVIHNTTNAIALNHNTSEIKLFPNPVQYKLNMRFPAEIPLQSCSIYDAAGRQVTYFEFTNYSSAKSLKELDVSSFQKGIYAVVLTFDNFNLTKKFIKE